MKYNCVTYTLDKMVDEGGRFIAHGSIRSPLMHVWHESPSGDINSYEANQRLSHWLISLVGYDGHVKHKPQRRQRQLTVFQIVLSCWVLAITASLWGISRMFRRKKAD